MISLAGQLGFAELSGLCVELENAARKGGGLDRLGSLRTAAERALAAAGRSRYAKPAEAA
jgi:hypothetical protein